jgi:hypothetical protein
MFFDNLDDYATPDFTPSEVAEIRSAIEAEEKQPEDWFSLWLEYRRPDAGAVRERRARERAERGEEN